MMHGGPYQGVSSSRLTINALENRRLLGLHFDFLPFDYEGERLRVAEKLVYGLGQDALNPSRLMEVHADFKLRGVFLPLWQRRPLYSTLI